MNKSVVCVTGAVLRWGGGVACPKPEPSPPNVLVAAAVCSIKTYYTAFIGLQNTPKCVSGPHPFGAIRPSILAFLALATQRL